MDENDIFCAVSSDKTHPLNINYSLKVFFLITGKKCATFKVVLIIINKLLNFIFNKTILQCKFVYVVNFATLL